MGFPKILPDGKANVGKVDAHGVSLYGRDVVRAFSVRQCSADAQKNQTPNNISSRYGSADGFSSSQWRTSM